MAEAADCLDECREKAFCSFSYMDLLTKGKAVSTQNSLLNVFEGRYGSTPLRNPNGIPAVVTTACKREKKKQGEQGGSSSRSDSKKKSNFYRPLLLRTYDYPGGDDDAANNDHNLESSGDLAESTSNIKLVEAMAATSAVPGLVDRVKVTIDDEPRSLADGYLCANDPTVIALNEARKLYPGRPIGLVLSIGYDDEDVHFANRAISIARLSHPNLHYQRIAPKHVFEHFSRAETSLKKIAVLEEQAYEYVDENIGVQRILDVSLDRLFNKKKKQEKKKVGFVLPEQDEKEEVESEEVFKTKFASTFDFSKRDYQRRTAERLEILFSQDASFAVKSKRLKSFKQHDDNLNDRGVVSLCCGGRANRNQVQKPLDELVFENKRVLEKQSTMSTYDSFLSKNQKQNSGLHSEHSIPSFVGIVQAEDHVKDDEEDHRRVKNKKVQFIYDLSGDNFPTFTNIEYTSS